MTLHLLALALLLQAVPAAAPGDAYLDGDARETVRLARARRLVVDRSIAGYETVARQRLSVGLRALRRDRVLFRRELAARIRWRRDAATAVEVLGAREAAPVVRPDPSVPTGLGAGVASMAFDPAEFRLFEMLGQGEDLLRHPLAEGSEADYRFRGGDTTRIALPDSTGVTLVELHVIPRRAATRLLRGSIWLDADTHDAVRAVFSLALPVSIGVSTRRGADEDGDGEDGEADEDADFPAGLGPVVAELRYITIEYGLWERRWWLPRLIALDVSAQIGSLANVPFAMEQTYGEYRIEESTGPLADASYPEPARDTTGAADSAGRRSRICRRGRCKDFTVALPADSASLLSSEELPPSIYAEGASLITEGELQEVAAVLGALEAARFPWRSPRVGLRFLQPGLLRYNRVEGLAAAGRVDADFGPARADAAVWVALAGPDVSGEVGLERRGFLGEQRLAAYRRLAAADPASRPLGTGNSLAALLLGRDDGDYFRALGAELTGQTAAPGPVRYDWRLFAERQRGVSKQTDFSIPRLLGADDGFRDNIAADPADEAGAELGLGLTGGQDPRGVRWGARIALAAAAGTFDFLKPSAGAFLGVPLPGRWVAAADAAAGTSVGRLPTQSRWYLGGPATLRGYGGAAAAGEAFWRARLEAATALPGARLVLFSDAGWAGARSAFTLDPTLLSAGVGAGLLDGLLRLDLSRRLRARPGWRLELYLDGLL